jgi:hypothetical protein
MPLAPGTKLGPYEIGVPLGAGTMFKEAYGQEPSESEFPITSIRGPFPDGDRQVDQSGTGTIVEIGVPDQLAKGAGRAT